jgi:hypothetical protein
MNDDNEDIKDIDDYYNNNKEDNDNNNDNKDNNNSNDKDVDNYNNDNKDDVNNNNDNDNDGNNKAMYGRQKYFSVATAGTGASKVRIREWRKTEHLGGRVVGKRTIGLR